MKFALCLEYRGPTFRKDVTFAAGLRVKQPRPWAAEILGPSAQHEMDRRFIDGQIDFSNANRRLTLGIEFHFILTVGRLHEIHRFVRYGETERVFVIPTEDSLIEVRRSEVEQWILHTRKAVDEILIDRCSAHLAQVAA